jgi:hypothetical protein
MKKTVLLGIAAVALLALPAFAGEAKWTGDWPGTWSYTSLNVCQIPVKMKVPFYVHITNQDPIWLVQVDCATIGKNPAKDGDWPCFKGCNDTDVTCNFNIKLSVDFAPSATGTAMFDGRYGKSVSPDTFTPPGGATKLCVWAWNVDLLGQAANAEVDLGTLTVKVKPN